MRPVQPAIHRLRYSSLGSYPQKRAIGGSSFMRGSSNERGKSSTPLDFFCEFQPWVVEGGLTVH